MIVKGRMQSDPIERKFSQYRQINGGHFLVSLNEVTNSEKILLCHSLVKEDIDFWNESALVTNPALNFKKLEQLLEENFVATEKKPLLTKVKKYPSTLQVTLQNNSILKCIVMFVLLVFQDALLM